MPREIKPGNATTRRYSEQERAAAVRKVPQLRQKLDTDHGTVKRVATQLGYGPESVRSWVRQADIDDGHAPGQSTGQSAREEALEQENLELRCANEILTRAAIFFGAELDRQSPR